MSPESRQAGKSTTAPEAQLPRHELAKAALLCHAQVRVLGIMLSVKNLSFCALYCLLSGKFVLGD